MRPTILDLIRALDPNDYLSTLGWDYCCREAINDDNPHWTKCAVQAGRAAIDDRGGFDRGYLRTPDGRTITCAEYRRLYALAHAPTPTPTIRDEVAALQPDAPMTGWYFTAWAEDAGWIRHEPSSAQETHSYAKKWRGCRLRSPHGHVITCPDFAALYEATHLVPATPETTMTTAPQTFTLTTSTPPAPDHSTYTAVQIYDTFDDGTPIFEKDGKRYLLTYANGSAFVLAGNAGFEVRLNNGDCPASLGYTYVGNLIL
jgi:hypothetical protein